MTAAAWIVPLVIAAALPLVVAFRRMSKAWSQAEQATSVVAPVATEADALDPAVPDLPA
jgi:hypothetical protein